VAEINQKPDQRIEVDSDLIAMFLRMSPEERILSNDNSIRMILDLRNAFKKRETFLCEGFYYNVKQRSRQICTRVREKEGK